MQRFSKWSGAGLDPTQTATVQLPSPEQSKILEHLERGALHVLKTGEHVPVSAMVMRHDGKIELIDLDRSFAHQDDALRETVMHLVPLAMEKQIMASGVMYQPGDPGQEKIPVLAFDLEQVGHPRFLVALSYEREGGVVTLGPKQYQAAPAKLLAE